MTQPTGLRERSFCLFGHGPDPHKAHGSRGGVICAQMACVRVEVAAFEQVRSAFRGVETADEFGDRRPFLSGWMG